ncbi:MAG: hypothetical protein L0Y71_09395 [Gemmataceae bacterium]|nr:hypothetical protein [Gemmataceae bacterium]
MIRRFGALLMLGVVGFVCQDLLFSQDLPVISTTGAEPAGETPEPPKGVEVQARGPIHEAFATPTAEAKPTYGVPKKPPEPIEEMPPDEKPEGDVVWIGGYWAWDDDRADYLWVSGCWRVTPPGKDWVPGYWREVSGQHQWVPGFWRTADEEQAADVTYYPEPPPPPQVAPPPPATDPDMFYVPGYWMWVGDHYVWRAGYYTRARPGYVYVASHYRWAPSGFVFVAGYWDYDIPRRGVLYAPVVVDTVVVGPRFVYTPYYAVSDTILVDAYFVRPGFCHYYYGDYYGPRYVSIGFECGYHYSRRHYDAIVVYNRWEHRHTPGWYDARISVTVARSSGRAPLPPRTLVQQNNITVINKTTNVYNTKVIAPTKTVVAKRGAKTVALDSRARMQVKQSANTFQKAAVTQRAKVEAAHRIAPGAQPRKAALNLPDNQKPAKGAAHQGLPKNPHPGAAPNLPKKHDFKGVPAKKDFKGPPIPHKAPGVNVPPKAKAKDPDGPGPRPGIVRPGGNPPNVKRPPDRPPPNRPPPSKRPADDNKKKGR